jgi:hypothetical protein
VNNYGQLWQPYGVGYGWQPFQDGSWAWYPGQGYVWVSSYPWGWTPYRYGSWINVPGYGWCWRAGPRWNSWAPVPVVVGGPSNFIAPVPPPIPGVSIVHVGHGGDPDFDRRHRDPRVSVMTPATAGSGAVTTSNGGTGPATVSPDVIRTRGGRDRVIDNDNMNAVRLTERPSRGIPANTAPINTIVTAPVQTTPATTPTVTPNQQPVAPIAPRVERPGRGESNDRPSGGHQGNFDRPARTFTTPPASTAPSAAPASAPQTSVSPPPSAPASAPAASGAREGRSSRSPK